MAGYSWRWNFYLEDEKGGAYRLSCEQVVTEDEAMTIEPVAGLRHGADVYDALDTMVSEVGYSLDETELPTIAAEIAKLNATLADQFKRGPELLECRHESAAQKVDAQREASPRALAASARMAWCPSSPRCCLLSCASSYRQQALLYRNGLCVLFGPQRA